ncbi:MAG: amidohydrolase family protein [Ignavibacteriaceae bacterium]|nr:amidohydrolase family protein [Ignavibacteriaceae bacterium]
MLIKNISILGNTKEHISIGTRGKIITKNYSNDLELDFHGAIAFPGLINSHDHLEFNLFPKLGNKIYEDYVEWGNDIHSRNKTIIEKIKSVPYELRFLWGLYKNLLCGVTTVAHHGKGKVINVKGMPDVISRYNYLHSIRLEKLWIFKLNLRLNNNPFVLHIGEGTNTKSYHEINDLIKWNITRRKIIGVHGVSLDLDNSKKIAALVWCPDSNIFLYNQTANLPEVKKGTDILFGSDSGLSSDWNIWNHIRLARDLKYLNEIELFESLSSKAARIWGLDNLGSISENKIADIIVANNNSGGEWSNYFNTNPENLLLILKGGQIVLLDQEYENINHIIDRSDFDLIAINNVGKYIRKGIKDLVDNISRYLPDYKFPFTVLN